MTDFDPNELVVELAKGLADRGVGSLTPAAQAIKNAEASQAAPEAKAASEAKAKAALVAKLADDADLPELVCFAGYLGGAVDREQGGKKWQLLYLDWQLSNWLLVRQDDIVFRKPPDEEIAQFELRDVIWVKANAQITRGSGPRSAQARFLRGEFTRAGDFSASPDGGTYSPSTGIFCEATTAGCCYSRTRR